MWVFLYRDGHIFMQFTITSSCKDMTAFVISDSNLHHNGLRSTYQYCYRYIQTVHYRIHYCNLVKEYIYHILYPPILLDRNMYLGLYMSHGHSHAKFHFHWNMKSKLEKWPLINNLYKYLWNSQMGSEHKVDGFDQPSRHKTSPSLVQVYVVLFCNDIDKFTEAP